MGVLDNLGYIKEAAHFPCAQENPILVIQAAGNAIGPVLLSASTFGCLDILRMRAGISPWHARGIRALINGAIPGEQIDAVQKIYKYTIPLEKALFFWFVVDLTTEFFARWQSQIFKLGACGGMEYSSYGSGAPCLGGSGGDNRWVYTSWGGWTNTGVPGRVYPYYAIVPKDNYFSCVFTVQAKSIIQNEPLKSVKTRVVQMYPNNFSYEPNVGTPGWFGETVSSTTYFNKHHPTTKPAVYSFQWCCEPQGIATGGSIAVTVSDRPVYNESIFPVNCLGQIPHNVG